MITLNLTKEEIEELYELWRSAWHVCDPYKEDTLAVKIQDAYIHRDEINYFSENENNTN